MVQENSLKDVIVICGPTASGKTALAISLAKRLNTEIISADALYIYKKLNIGTAKPDLVEMDGIFHHLIDVIEPTEEFSVSDFERLATPIIDRLHSEGKIPIICGGTGFYIQALLYDIHNYFLLIQDIFLHLLMIMLHFQILIQMPLLIRLHINRHY